MTHSIGMNEERKKVFDEEVPGIISRSKRWGSYEEKARLLKFIEAREKSNWTAEQILESVKNELDFGQ